MNVCYHCVLLTRLEQGLLQIRVAAFV